MKFLRSFSLFESKKMMDQNLYGSLINLFREKLLRKENVDFILQTTGTKIEDKIKVSDKTKTLWEKEIYIKYHCGSIRTNNTFTLDITKKYKNDITGICEYLNNLGDINNNYEGHFSNESLENKVVMFLSVYTFEHSIRIGVIFYISFVGKKIINIDESFSDSRSYSNYEITKHTSELMDYVNYLIDKNMENSIAMIEGEHNKLYSLLKSKIADDPETINIIKKYPNLWNKIRNKDIDDTGVMLDMGFFD
jgi:hypothetical protein